MIQESKVIFHVGIFLSIQKENQLVRTIGFSFSDLKWIDEDYEQGRQPLPKYFIGVDVADKTRTITKLYKFQIKKLFIDIVPL